MLTEGLDGGEGSISARHTFTQNGIYTVQVCVTDNVTVDVNGNKSPTAASVTACHPIQVTVAPMTDLLLDVEESGDPLPLTGTLVYSMSVINHAPDVGLGLTATGLVVSDTLDSRVTFQYANTGQGSCGQSGGVITCKLNALAPGQTALIQIGVTLNSGLAAGDRLYNQASFRINEPNQAEMQETFETTTLVTPSDYIVNTVEDANDASPGNGTCATSQNRCTLRAAIQEANSRPGAQTIALGYETYVVSPTLQLTGSLTVTGLGAGNSLLAANGADRVLTISGGATVTLNDLAVTGGNTTGLGGGLYNNGGFVTLNGVQVSGNNAQGGGGGIHNTGSLTITRSALTGNHGANASGGGLRNDGAAALLNVTISGNTAGAGGGILSLGTATLTNVTISNNSVSGSGGGLNGGPANFMLFNTILAGNRAAIAGPNCGYSFTSQGYNLIDDLSDCTVAGATNTNIVGQGARLDPPDLNGAATLTHALQLVSPAIDAGSCALAADQRGVARPQLGGCDIGAFEFIPVRIYLPLIAR